MDLNDLRYFALIVEHGGFSAAERHAHITKSKLSRRVALLEDQLGVRLLQRSTRRLALTDAGRVFYEHCAAVVTESEAAQSAIDRLQSEPSGTVRMICPAVIAQLYLARLVAAFMRSNPKVRVELETSERRAQLIDERIDIAIRPRDSGLDEPGLVSRQLTTGRLVLVASPAYLEARQGGEITAPEQISTQQHDTVGQLQEGAEQTWMLTATDGRKYKLVHRPRLVCSDYGVQYEAALGGVGIAFLPLRVVWGALNAGTLVRVAKDWGTPEEGIHVVFVSKRGMLPSVRALVDYLVLKVPTAMAD